MSATTSIKPLTQRPAFKALAAHHKKIKNLHLRKMFADDPKRGERLTAEAPGLCLDYSKNRVTDQTLKLLVQLARESDLSGRIAAMFSGEKINITENRAVLHVALRAPKGANIVVDGKNVVPEVHAVLDKMAAFSDRVRSGKWKGHTGKRIRNVVNIGIGGSDLGPVMAYEALKHYSERAMTFRFVSNVDGIDFVEATRDLDPAETLFIVSSKTFTTLETMTNAQTRARLVAQRNRRRREGRRETFRGGFDQRRKGVRRSALIRPTCSDSGTGWADVTRWIPPSASRRCWPSARKTSARCSKGFHEMDNHFRTAPFEKNLPVLHGFAVDLVQRFSRAQIPWRFCLTSST